jgi:hypothetical protein
MTTATTATTGPAVADSLENLDSPENQECLAALENLGGRTGLGDRTSQVSPATRGNRAG